MPNACKGAIRPTLSPHNWRNALRAYNMHVLATRAYNDYLYNVNTIINWYAITGMGNWPAYDGGDVIHLRVCCTRNITPIGSPDQQCL